MRKDGSDSDPRPLPAVLGPVVVAAGVAAMLGAIQLATLLPFRPRLVFAEACLALPGLVALALLGRSLGPALALHRLKAREAALSVAAGASFWAASLGLFELQYVVWQPPPGFLEMFRHLHEALRPAGPLDAALSVATIAMAPAAFEELLFRGIVLPSFRRSLGAMGAILASAVLFGLIHVDAASWSFYRVPFAFAVGLGLGILRERSGGILPPIFAHATLNTITFVLAPLVDDPSETPAARPALGAALFVVGSALGAWVLSRFRPRVDRDQDRA